MIPPATNGKTPSYKDSDGDHDSIDGGWAGTAFENLEGGVSTDVASNRVLRKERLQREMMLETLTLLHGFFRRDDGTALGLSSGSLVCSGLTVLAGWTLGQSTEACKMWALLIQRHNLGGHVWIPPVAS